MSWLSCGDASSSTTIILTSSILPSSCVPCWNISYFARPFCLWQLRTTSLLSSMLLSAYSPPKRRTRSVTAVSVAHPAPNKGGWLDLALPPSFRIGCGAFLVTGGTFTCGICFTSGAFRGGPSIKDAVALGGCALTGNPVSSALPLQLSSTNKTYPSASRSKHLHAPLPLNSVRSPTIKRASPVIAHRPVSSWSKYNPPTLMPSSSTHAPAWNRTVCRTTKCHGASILLQIYAWNWTTISNCSPRCLQGSSWELRFSWCLWLPPSICFLL